MRTWHHSADLVVSIRMVSSTGVDDLADPDLLSHRVGELLGGAACICKSDPERSEPPPDEECGMGVQASPEGDDPPLDLLVQGPVVGADGAGDNVRVAGKELGHGVDDSVRAKLEGTRAVGRRKRVVDDYGCPDGLRSLGYRGDVHEPKLGVGQRLAVHDGRAMGGDRLAPTVGIEGIDPHHGHTESRQITLDQIARVAVHLTRRNKHIPGAEQRQQRRGDGCHAASRHQRLLCTVEPSNVGCGSGDRRVAEP